MEIVYQIFNKLSFCPKCFGNGLLSSDEDIFIFFDQRDNLCYKEKVGDWRIHPDFVLLSKGFTPHIFMADYISLEDQVIYSLNCSICEVSFKRDKKGKTYCDFLQESNGIMTIPKWNEIISVGAF